MNSVVNLILFKIGWIAVVGSAAGDIPLAGTLAVAIVVLVRLLQAENRPAELRLLAAAGIMGLVWESTLVGAGIVSYPSGMLFPGVAPYWIVAMWLLFATTLNAAMRWLRRHVLVASAAGAIGGPLAFYAGSAAGAVSFPDPAAALVAIGAGWALMLPLLVRLSVSFGRALGQGRSGQLAGESRS